MDYAQIKKFNRRARYAEWADECLHRAIEAGSMRRARRAAFLSEALNAWLDMKVIGSRN